MLHFAVVVVLIIRIAWSLHRSDSLYVLLHVANVVWCAVVSDVVVVVVDDAVLFIIVMSVSAAAVFS